MRDDRYSPTGPFRERLRYAATCTSYYTGPALKLLGTTLARLEADIDRQEALSTCRKILDPDNTRSTWQIAHDIAEQIPRLNRIRLGRLLTPLEEALITVSQGATHPVNLHRELAQLR